MGIAYRVTRTSPAPAPSNQNKETTETATTTPKAEGEHTVVNIEQEFTLKKNDTAHFGENTLTLTDFVYSPCPKDANCFWSGLAVLFELVVDGKKYTTSSYGNLPPEAPYRVIIKNSNYKTFATFVIQKLENN